VTAEFVEVTEVKIPVLPKVEEEVAGTPSLDIPFVDKEAEVATLAVDDISVDSMRPSLVKVTVASTSDVSVTSSVVGCWLVW
jgi:hypothetical protein